MRWQTPTVCEIQAPLTRRGFLTCVAQVPALKGRPTVKRRDAARTALVTRDGTHKLLDFGISKLLEAGRFFSALKK